MFSMDKKHFVVYAKERNTVVFAKDRNTVLYAQEMLCCQCKRKKYCCLCTRNTLFAKMLSLRVTSEKWTLFCVHYYSKLLMRIYINYIPLEAWVHCLQTATVNWYWDNISMEIFKKKTDFFQYLAHPPLWKKQESGKTWCHGFSFSCGCIRKQRLFKPPDHTHMKSHHMNSLIDIHTIHFLHRSRK